MERAEAALAVDIAQAAMQEAFKSIELKIAILPRSDRIAAMTVTLAMLAHRIAVLKRVMPGLDQLCADMTPSAEEANREIADAFVATLRAMREKRGGGRA